MSEENNRRSQSNTFAFSEIISLADTIILEQLQGKQFDYQGLDDIYYSVLGFLNNNGISYEQEISTRRTGDICIRSAEVEVNYHKALKSPGDTCSALQFSIAIESFLRSFDLLTKLFSSLEFPLMCRINLHMKKEYHFISFEENAAALLTSQSGIEVCNMHGDEYFCREWGLGFEPHDFGKTRPFNMEYIIGIKFDRTNASAENIISLIELLWRIGYIYRA